MYQKWFLKAWFGVVACLIASYSTHAQTNFRTNLGGGTGNWSSTATWQVESPNGSNNWINATSTPTSSSNNISIISGDHVFANLTVTVDQVSVAANATITI